MLPEEVKATPPFGTDPCFLTHSLLSSSSLRPPALLIAPATPPPCQSPLFAALAENEIQTYLWHQHLLYKYRSAQSSLMCCEVGSQAISLIVLREEGT